MWECKITDILFTKRRWFWEFVWKFCTDFGPKIIVQVILPELTVFWTPLFRIPSVISGKGADASETLLNPEPKGLSQPLSGLSWPRRSRRLTSLPSRSRILVTFSDTCPGLGSLSGESCESSLAWFKATADADKNAAPPKKKKERGEWMISNIAYSFADLFLIRINFWNM